MDNEFPKYAYLPHYSLLEHFPKWKKTQNLSVFHFLLLLLLYILKDKLIKEY